MSDADNLLQSYIQKVLKLQQEQKQRPLDQQEMQRIAEELGMTDSDLAYIQKKYKDYVARGQGYSRYEDWESAIEEFEQAFELNPASVDALFGLANAYKNVWLANKDKEALQKAKTFVKRALQIDPEHDASFRLAGELNKGVTSKTNPIVTNSDTNFGDWRSWEDDFKNLTHTFKKGLKGAQQKDTESTVKTVMRNLSEKRLTRSTRDRRIMGVCGGLAEYFSIDPTWVRIAFLVGLFSGISPLLYIVMGFAMPKDSK